MAPPTGFEPVCHHGQNHLLVLNPDRGGPMSARHRFGRSALEPARSDARRFLVAGRNRRSSLGRRVGLWSHLLIGSFPLTHHGMPISRPPLIPMDCWWPPAKL